MGFPCSLEKFLVLRNAMGLAMFCEPEGKIGVKPDREFLRTEQRRLSRQLAALGIDIGVFKRGRTYQITEKTARLFLYVLDYFGALYFEQIRAGNWGDLPLQSLLEVRNDLIEALYSVEYTEEEVKRIVVVFEEKTSCPPLKLGMKLSEFTIGVLEYMKGDRSERVENSGTSNRKTEKSLGFKGNEDEVNEVKLDNEIGSEDLMECAEKFRDKPYEFSREQWAAIGQQIEYQYRFFWRPKLVSSCLKMLENYPEDILENDDETILLKQIAQGGWADTN